MLTEKTSNFYGQFCVIHYVILIFSLILVSKNKNEYNGSLIGTQCKQKLYCEAVKNEKVIKPWRSNINSVCLYLQPYVLLDMYKCPVKKIRGNIIKYVKECILISKPELILKNKSLYSQPYIPLDMYKCPGQENKRYYNTEK